MAKLNRATVVAEALDLLDEVGLDAVSTRRLAKRLGVEQPSLYWHFRKKEDLLAAMAQAAMEPHAADALPEPPDDWREWFLENTRDFRRTLLMHRDGARLHAGILPGTADLDRIAHKMRFLTDAGLPQREAQMAMLAASRHTVGCVLEEQADNQTDGQPPNPTVPHIDHESAFEAGLALILQGLITHTRP
ncbi:MAG: TetR/AcrR family transcriptional regulator C-terminal domain-containing protein [Nocardioidaceae bacterium]